MMHIIFERTGGIMGRKVSLNLNLNEMPLDQSSTLRRLVDEADFFNLEETPAHLSRPDEFLYTITVTTGTIQHIFRTSDSSAPAALRPLLTELVERSHEKR